MPRKYVPAITQPWTGLEARILANLEELAAALHAEQCCSGPITMRAYQNAAATLTKVGAQKLFLEAKAAAKSARLAAAARARKDRERNGPQLPLPKARSA